MNLDSMARISIIVINYKNYDLLLKCLESIFKSNFPKEQFEVIVVDCLTPFERLEEIKRLFPSIKIIHFDKDIGASASHNIGAKNTSVDTEYLVFLDNDVILDPDCLSHLTEVADKHKAGAVQARILDIRGAPQYVACYVDDLGFVHLIRDLKDLVLNRGKIINGLGSTCCCIRKDVYVKLRGFDEDFWVYHDDQDFGLKMSSQGSSVAIAYDAIAYHIGGFTTKDRSLFYLRRNNYIMIIKNFPLACCIRALLCQILYDFRPVLVAMKRKEGRKVLAIFSALWWILRNLRHLYRKRLENKCYIRTMRLNRGSPILLLPKILRNK